MLVYFHNILCELFHSKHQTLFFMFHISIVFLRFPFQIIFLLWTRIYVLFAIHSVHLPGFCWSSSIQTPRASANTDGLWPVLAFFLSLLKQRGSRHKTPFWSLKQQKVLFSQLSKLSIQGYTASILDFWWQFEEWLWKTDFWCDRL